MWHYFTFFWWYYITCCNQKGILQWHVFWCLWWFCWSQWITDIKTLLYCIGDVVQHYPVHVVEPSILLMLWMFWVMKECNVEGIDQRFRGNFEPQDVDSRFLWYVGDWLSDGWGHNLEAHNLIAVKTSNFTYAASSLPLSFYLLSTYSSLTYFTVAFVLILHLIVFVLDNIDKISFNNGIYFVVRLILFPYPSVVWI